MHLPPVRFGKWPKMHSVVLCSEAETPFFVPSPEIRSPERPEGAKDGRRPPWSGATATGASLTPEHAEGRYRGEMGFFCCTCRRLDVGKSLRMHVQMSWQRCLTCLISTATQEATGR